MFRGSDFSGIQCPPPSALLMVDAWNPIIKSPFDKYSDTLKLPLGGYRQQDRDV